MKLPASLIALRSLPIRRYEIGLSEPAAGSAPTAILTQRFCRPIRREEAGMRIRTSVESLTFQGIDNAGMLMTEAETARRPSHPYAAAVLDMIHTPVGRRNGLVGRFAQASGLWQPRCLLTAMITNLSLQHIARRRREASFGVIEDVFYVSFSLLPVAAL